MSEGKVNYFSVISEVPTFTKNHFDSLIAAGQKRFLIELLQKFYPIFDIHFFENEGLKFNISHKEDWKPLSEFGFGTNRIFEILTSILFSVDRILLIDEIDLGIHFSVQETFWNQVFVLAKGLNVQIFATTHSRDCFDAFAKIANEDENKGTGKFIRLKDNGLTIRAVEYDDEDIESAAESGIEVR